MKSKNNVDWDLYAEQYDIIVSPYVNPAYALLIQKVVEFFEELPVRSDSFFVDLGGGTGNFSLALAVRYPNSHFVILDGSRNMLSVAEDKIKDMGLSNVETIQADMENLDEIIDTYGRKIDYALMIHSLYATRSFDDPEKPFRILKKVRELLNDEDSRLFLLDVNRRIKIWEWSLYCFWNTLKHYKNPFSLLSLLSQTREAREANRLISQKQRAGEFLICSLEELESLVRDAGFSRIYEKSDKYYRGLDNLIIAGK